MRGDDLSDQKGHKEPKKVKGFTSEHFELFFASELEAALPKLRLFAYGLCRSHPVADDLVQIACLKAWNSRGKFDPNRSMLGWMKRITKNVFIDDFRAKARRANVLLSIDENDFAPLISPTSNSQDEMLDLLNAMNALSNTERSVVLMRAMAGLSYHQISDSLGLSPGNARKIYSRSLSKLGHYNSEGKTRSTAMSHKSTAYETLKHEACQLTFKRYG